MDMWDQLLMMLDKLAIRLGSEPELARGRVTLVLFAVFFALAFGSVVREELREKRTQRIERRR